MSNMNGMSPMNQMANMGMNMHSNMMGMSTMSPNMGKMGPSLGPSQSNGYGPRRLAPYPTPSMHMGQKRSQQGYANGGAVVGNMQQFSNGQYPYGNGTGRPGFVGAQGQYPPQQTMGNAGNFAPGQMRSSGLFNHLFIQV